jgi:zinc-ribbons
MDSSSPPSKGQVETVSEPDTTPRSERGPFELGPSCPSCGEPWLRPTQLPGRYRCVFCLTRFQLMAYCPACGEHSTIVRMSDTEELTCVRCGGSMLKPV